MLILLLAALQSTPAAALPSPGQVVAQSPASAWQDIPADELLVMSLAGGKRVVIQLAPSFAPVHVKNIRQLAADHWWDHTGIDRVHDNYVVQWGGATVPKPLPAGIQQHPPAEYTFASDKHRLHTLDGRDAYAPRVGYMQGWPVAIDAGQGTLLHCYGMVGAGRENSPDTGTGAELYAVIGHAPRHLDRNMALVGRVVEGMGWLSGLPRGTGSAGMYEHAAERPPIESIRLASELPQGERPHYQVMDVHAPVFADYLKARANRRDEFFIHNPQAVDICNAPVPVRPSPAQP